MQMPEPKSYGFEQPPGERRFKFHIKRQSFYFKDIIDRIEGFSREIVMSRMQTKGRVSDGFGSSETFQHRSSVSADRADFARTMSGLTDTGKIDMVIIPEQFDPGSVEQDDLLTVFNVDIRDSFGGTKCHGVSALINETQGWNVVHVDLKCAADALMQVKIDVALWFLAPIGVISGIVLVFVFAMGNAPDGVVGAGIGGLAFTLVGHGLVELRREKRRERFAEFLRKRLEGLVGEHQAVLADGQQR
jgi:hypothetical protein